MLQFLCSLKNNNAHMLSNYLFPDSLEFSLEDAVDEGESQNRMCKSLSLESEHNH